MSKFKIGDKVTGKPSNGYCLTTNETVCIVEKVFSNDIEMLVRIKEFSDNHPEISEVRSTIDQTHNVCMDKFVLIETKRINVKEKAKTIALATYEKVKPYEKYVMFAVVLVVIDHFFLKGAMKNKTKEISSKLFTKISKKFESLIDMI